MWRWPYGHFETSVLAWIHDKIDLKKILRGPKESDRLFLVENQIEGLKGKKKELEEKRDRTFELFHTMPDSTEYVGSRLANYEQEIRKVDGDIARATEQRAILLAEADALNAGQDIKGLISTLRSEQTDQYKVRQQLATRLRTLISEIVVKTGYTAKYIIDSFKMGGVELGAEEEAEMLRSPRPFLPDFIVMFKNGEKEIYTPWTDPFDPVATVMLDSIRDLENDILRRQQKGEDVKFLQSLLEYRKKQTYGGR